MMNPLGERTPVAFPTFPAFQTGAFDMSAAMRSPLAWTTPFWDFYAAAAQSSLDMWSAALSMRPGAMENVFAEAQKTMMRPMQAFAAPQSAQPIAIIAETIEAPVEALQAAADTTFDAATETLSTVADLPSRIETADEPEPAMVGGEAAPISPIIAAKMAED
jgi:hypothetical protein